MAITPWFTGSLIESLHTGQVRRTRPGVYIDLSAEPETFFSPATPSRLVGALLSCIEPARDVIILSTLGRPLTCLGGWNLFRNPATAVVLDVFDPLYAEERCTVFSVSLASVKASNASLMRRLLES